MHLALTLNISYILTVSNELTDTPYNYAFALVVLERDVGLEGVVQAGTQLDAHVTSELLNTIFWPGSALHDMAVVIRGERVIAAGVQLPLAEAEQYSQELGSRHRAAYGLSLECDALVVVVSEETGTISLAERGRLVRNLSPDGLRTALVRGMGEMKSVDGADLAASVKAKKTT